MLLLRNIVDEFLDKHGLAYTGTAEETYFTTFAIRLEKVNYLDAGSENFGTDSEVFELGSGLVD